VKNRIFSKINCSRIVTIENFDQFETNLRSNWGSIELDSSKFGSRNASRSVVVDRVEPLSGLLVFMGLNHGKVNIVPARSLLSRGESTRLAWI